MPITHTKVSAKSDGGDATLVLPSDWNASHSGGSGAHATTGKLTGGNYTITTTSFADVDATNAKVTLTTGANLLQMTVLANGTLGTTNYLYLDLDIDGTRQGGSNGLVAPSYHSGGGTEHPLCFTYFATVTAASHTIKLMAKVDGGSATLYASSTWPLMLTAVEHP